RRSGARADRADADRAPAPPGGGVPRQPVARRAAGGERARHAVAGAGADGLLGGAAMRSGPSRLSRLSAVIGGLALWVCLIAARCYQLQVVRYDHYAGKAARQQQRVVVLDPPRGTIYDSRGRELAVSVQVDSAYAVPPQIQDARAAAAAIARVLPGLDGARLARQLAQDREFVWVARKIDQPLAAKLRALDLPGIY